MENILLLFLKHFGLLDCTFMSVTALKTRLERELNTEVNVCRSAQCVYINFDELGEGLTLMVEDLPSDENSPARMKVTKVIL